MFKKIKKKELVIAIIILLIGVILSLGIKSYLDNVYANNKLQEEIPFSAHLAGCKKGECSEYVDTQDQYKATFECLGEMKGLLYWNTKTIDLNNGNILIYQLGSTFPGELNIKDYRATLLNIKNQQILMVYNYLDYDYNVYNQTPMSHIEDIDYILEKEHCYYLNPYVDYSYYKLNDSYGDTKTLNFLYKEMLFRKCYPGIFVTPLINGHSYGLTCGSISENRNDLRGLRAKIGAYEQIIKANNYPSRKLFKYYGDVCIPIMFVNTFNHKLNLYAASCKGCSIHSECNKIWKDCNQVFLEDPINLKRSKFGQLNEPIDFMTAEMVSKNKIYLISANNIELFNPETVDVKLITKHKSFTGKTYSVLLKDNKIFALNPETKQYLVFNPEINKITASGKIDSLFNNPEYADTYDITLLKNGLVLIYGLTMEVYNPEVDKYYSFKNQLTKRMGAKLTTLQDGNVLITGGFLDIDLAKKLLNKDEGFIYNSAELLKIQELNNN